MTSVITTSLGSVDRPDIVKEVAKKQLSFKEVKESFFKFLLRANIPFSNEDTRLSIFNTFESRISGASHSVESAFYTATCRLEGIKVNKAPVYVIVLNTCYRDVPHRQRNKLLTLKKHYNLIIFDKDDWSSFDLKISDIPWLDRISKSTTKRWVKSLFKKITSLGGKVEATYTLNDVYEHLDAVYGYDKAARLEGLLEENKTLRAELFIALFSGLYEVNKRNIASVKDLADLNEKSLKWVEKTVSLLISELHSVNFRSKAFQKAISRHRLMGAPESENLLAYLTYKMSKHSLSVTRLAPNIYTLQSLDTFQELTVHFDFLSKESARVISLGKEVSTRLKGTLISISLTIPKVPSKLGNIGVYLVSKSKVPRKGVVAKDSCVKVYDPEVDKVFNLWMKDQVPYL